MAKTFLLLIPLFWLGFRQVHAQQMPVNVKADFMALIQKNQPLETYQEAKQLLQIFPDDKVLKLVESKLNGELGEIANKQLGITAVFGNGAFINVFGQANHSYSGQVFEISRKFPEKWINEQWAKGFDITSLGGTAEGWLIVMSKFRDGRRGGQLWRTSSDSGEWLQTEIAKLWESDKKIVKVAGGPEGWGLVMESVPGWGKQRFACKSNWPEEWIKARKDEGYTVTSVSSGSQAGVWHYFVVVTQGAGASDAIVKSEDAGQWLAGKWKLEGGFYFPGEPGQWYRHLISTDRIIGANFYDSSKLFEVGDKISRMRNGTIFDQ